MHVDPLAEFRVTGSRDRWALCESGMASPGKREVRHRTAAVLLPALLSVTLGCGANLSTGRRPASSEIETFRDPTARMAITDIMMVPTDRWLRPTGAFPDLGYTDHALWVRFRPGLIGGMATTGNQPLVLHSGYLYLDRIDAWSVGSQGGPQFLGSAGDSLPFSLWSIQHRTPSIAVPAGNSPDLLYVRVASNGPVRFPLTVFTHGEYSNFVHREYLLIGAYFGALIIMFAYNLFVGISVREPTYPLYAAYLAATIWYSLFNLGLGVEFLWPDLTWWNNQGLSAFAAAAILLAFVFSWSFLDVGRNFPALKWAALVFGAFAAALVPGSFVLPYRVGLLSASYLSALSAALLLFLGLLLWFRGSKEARYFVFAWAAMLISVLLVALGTSDLAPNPFGLYALQVGSVLEMALLSFALADRINVLRSAKEAAQRDADLARQRMTESLSRANHRLSTLLAATEDLATVSDVQSAFGSFVRHVGAAQPLLRQKPMHLVLEPGLAHLVGSEHLEWRPHNDYPVPSQAAMEGLLDKSLWRATRLTHGEIELGTIFSKTTELWQDPILPGLHQSLATTLNSIRLAGRSRLTTVGEFAAGLIHEIKSDMSAIRYLSESITKADTERSVWSALQRSLEDLGILAEDVLDFAKDQIHTRLVQLSANELGELLQRSARQCFEGTNITSRLSIRTSAAATADPALMGRLARNLASNSAQAIGSRHASFSIELRASNEKHIEVLFQDSGPGIPESLRPIIFAPFVSRGKATGHGIGLAFARRIAEIHNGTLSVADADQSGAAFLLRMPMLAAS